MSQKLEEQYRKAERQRIASERQVDANIRIKESIEQMDQRLHSIEVTVESLKRNLDNYITKHGRLQLEVYQKLSRYLDDWK